MAIFRQVRWTLPVFHIWMYRIALNVAISFYRSESTRTRHVISDEQHLLKTVDKTESQPEDVRLLYQFIEELDPLNRALILLYLDGNSYQEIADVLVDQKLDASIR